MPPPLGKQVVIRCFVDADHTGLDNKEVENEFHHFPKQCPNLLDVQEAKYM